MRRYETIRRTILATTGSCLLLASCSTGSGSEGGSDRTQQMQGTLCDTSISTSTLREMYPGPYLEVWMSPDDDGGIKDADTVNTATHGNCDISITQKKGKVFSVVSVHVRTEPQKSAESLFRFYKRIYPDHLKQRLDLGAAKGFTTPEKSVLVFDCRNTQGSTSEESNLGAVSVQVLLPSHHGPFSVDRAKIARVAAKLVADTARYVNSEVLKCSGTPLPDGAPTRKANIQ